MSDYLSSLAARSLRRESACEPRRAQMFEPRRETRGAGVNGEAYEGLPGEESFEGIAPETPTSSVAHTPRPPAPGAPAVYERDDRVAPDPGGEAYARPSHTPPHVAGEGVAPNLHASPRHTDAQEAPLPPSPASPLVSPHDTLQIPDPLQTPSPLRTSAMPSQTPRPTAGEDVPTVRETTPPRVARRAQQQQAVSNETRPHGAETIAADETPAAHAPREVMLIPQTQPLGTPQAADVSDTQQPHVPTRRSSSRAAAQTPPPAHVAAPADDDAEQSPSTQPLIPTVRTSSTSSARQTHEARYEEGGEAGRGGRLGLAVGAFAVDEEGREQTSPAARRAGEPALEGSTTGVEMEVVPQPHSWKPTRPAETSTRSDFETGPGGALQPRTSEASARVRPAAAQTPTANARVAALTVPDVHAGAGLNGVRASAREGVAQPAPPPTIEVTIGRIEVRAVTPPAAAPPRPRERHEPPRMSLDDYLRAQGGGRG